MNLLNNLLPLPSGYFGASSALYKLGGLIITYGPAGGAWHINIEDEPRWYRGKTTVVGAGLLEIDVILGRDPEWVKRISTVALDLKPNFIALCGTPISAIIGVDLKGLARSIEKKTGIPVFFIETKGAEDYLSGAEKAFLALAKTFFKPSRTKRKRALNILGAIHLDIGKEEHLKPLCNLLQKADVEIISCWGMEENLENIKKSTEASLNLVITVSGIGIAEYMYENFGIPYIIGLPVGEKGEKDFLKVLEKISKEGAPFVEFSEEREKIDKKAVIIGEPIISYGIKRFLKEEIGLKEVSIISILPLGNLFNKKGCLFSFVNKEEGDFYTTSEERIEKYLNQSEVDIVIADPLYKRLLKSEKVFIPLPHVAMSCRFYWDYPYEFAGKPGGEYFIKNLKDVI
ncbi:MAG: Nitrogenase Mo-Fe protein NifD/coenzyme F430 biosynthesis subunit CfbD [Thermodesulfobacterium sp.]|uniref:Nitrogenase Mo-Fe protein NifD/coenzyme F430 biosynthesis subunit CfbD n=1 Tax=Candidatus Thermodesulfobacterium syntrophicum TaxID=3060442 RepID=A0AAE3P387_9BACT|nr:Nitrogenase Mo-Fe protein NifD/coenzyme F430 biosynthesis subunit CfbD [Candidatus Thermodesulfobacterium syntrophicum]